MKNLLIVIISAWILFFGVWNTEAYYEYSSCATQYWTFSISSWVGMCWCMSWYSFWKDMFWDKKCISNDQLCSDEFGHGAKANANGTCSCKYWYKWNSSWTSCEVPYCPLFSNFNDTIKSCECMSWYTMNNLGTCEEKKYSKYVYIKELDTLNRKLILSEKIWEKYYYSEIDYWYGCYSINRYLNKLAVVNTWNNYSIDKWDKIVLQDDQETCDIKSIRTVDYYYTLESCESRFGVNSVQINSTINSCGCKIWYMISDEWDRCVLIPSKKVTCKKWQVIKNGKCRLK